MIKKEDRKIEEHIEISDSVTATVTRRVIIPHNFTNLNLEVNYFNPRFKKVVRGEDVVWVNEDINTHHLDFYDLSDQKFEFLFESNPIKPNNSFKKKFDFDQTRIDYVCRLHENEVGAVIIYPKQEGLMTNTENLRFLHGVSNFELPEILGHLRSK